MNENEATLAEVACPICGSKDPDCLDGCWAVPERPRWYVFEANRRFLGRVQTTEAEIRQNFRRVMIEGNLVRILSV